MAEQRTLVDGLGGAIGCHYHQPEDRLFLVEFDGKISRVDLVRRLDAVISSGTTLLRGTFQFDFDTGAQAPGDADWDVWWQQHTDVKRSMTPQGGAQLAYLGAVSFARVSHAELQRLNYSGDSINGSDTDDNQLFEGAVFAVRTTDGNLAKVRVVRYGRNLEIEWRTYRLEPRYEVLGTGYDRPEDIVLSRDGRHAYVTERGGDLLYVDLGDADRSQASVVSSGMTAPHQIALDEERSHAYVVEFARPGPGRLLRVDLTTGAQATVFGALEGAIGLLVDDDLDFAYVTEQTGGGGAGNGQLSRIELSSGRREVLVGGMDDPFLLAWNDQDESGILTTERDPANRISRVDLTVSPAEVVHLLDGVPFRPSSLAVVGEDRLLLCSNDVVSEVLLSPFDPSQPLLLGIGHVPFDRISTSADAPAGYADTTVDPDYFFQVKDAPFGGTLPLKINHDRAWEEGARLYRVLVDGVVQRDAWSDYRWSAHTDRFELRVQTPTRGYFRVRGPDELWFHHWLGYRLSTIGLSNALHTITVQFFAPTGGSPLASQDLEVMVDNQRPRAEIEVIRHNHATDGWSDVGTCGIVTDDTDQFVFELTAHDPEGHLQSWSLSVVWGDDRSDHVASESYTPAPDRRWDGLLGEERPPRSAPWTATKPGDPTSRRCAHTFLLHVWDRVINGEHRIHRSRSTESITLLLPDAS